MRSVTHDRNGLIQRSLKKTYVPDHGLVAEISCRRHPDLDLGINERPDLRHQPARELAAMNASGELYGDIRLADRTAFTGYASM